MCIQQLAWIQPSFPSYSSLRLTRHSNCTKHRHPTASLRAVQPPPCLLQQPTASSMVASSMRVLELYSGLGGWHYGLKQALPDSMQLDVTAVDINTTANLVYEYNFGVRPRTLNLEQVAATELDALGAQLWCMSPPCQPYTTTKHSKQRDTEDPRAASFLHLLTVLPSMSCQPQYIILENVTGFVGSGSHEQLLRVLQDCDYKVQQFVMSPHQLGIPYSRPRYFALAKKQPLTFADQQYSQQINYHPPALPQIPHATVNSTASSHPPSVNNNSCDIPLQAPCTSSDNMHHLEAATLSHDVHSVQSSWPDIQLIGPNTFCRPLSHFLQSRTYNPQGSFSQQLWQQFAIPVRVLSKFHKVMDVVTHDSTYSNCFTKHYAQNILGAGSVLADPCFVSDFCRVDSRGRMHMTTDPTAPAAINTPSKHCAVFDTPANDTSISTSSRHDTSINTPTKDTSMDTPFKHNASTCTSACSDNKVAYTSAHQHSLHETADEAPIEQRSNVCMTVMQEHGLHHTPPAIRAEEQTLGVTTGVSDMRHASLLVAVKPSPTAPMNSQSSDSLASATQSQASCTNSSSASGPPHAAGSRNEIHLVAISDTTESNAVALASAIQNSCTVTDSSTALQHASMPTADSFQGATIQYPLRYFTPREVANIHGLPKDSFTWPASISDKHIYRLLGNGLSIHCVAWLLKYLFLEPHSHDPGSSN